LISLGLSPEEAENEEEGKRKIGLKYILGIILIIVIIINFIVGLALPDYVIRDDRLVILMHDRVFIPNIDLFAGGYNVRFDDIANIELFYNTDKAFAEYATLPIEPCDYVISEAFGDAEYFQLTCLSPGKEGLIGGTLKMQEPYAIFGAELKRMLVSDLYKVMINFNPQITIE